ncbi:apoptosis regulatory protein Siva-like [Chelonus insularis]|uniref:apoptosis regulatory protein Siva-like n=1 Tax=Chelonus insularis TaxID=460826 RepID=UPI001589A0B3|nr:apoptosis regulatory protein Siva-like [Chelonus insularis]
MSSDKSNTSSEEVMHKRCCPFEENLTPLMKIHVGPREAADGDEKEEEMRKIYDRTLQMLKNGPKLTESHPSENQETKTTGYHFEAPRFKQMVLNDKLQLEVSKKIILPLDTHTCTNCKQLKVVDRTRCFLCVEYHCPNCLSECKKCLEQFCKKCSLTIYDDGEHVECLACYR